MSDITVVIPVFNDSLYLAAAIESVLAQSIGEVRTLVIDDGSTDDSGAVAARYGARVDYIRVSHGGIGAARNEGVQRVETEYLAFQDADDIWEVDKLAQQRPLLQQNSKCDLVFGHQTEFISPELSPAQQARTICNPLPLPGIRAATLLMRTADFRRAGDFRADLRLGEFIEWYARAMDAGLRPQVLDSVVCRRRVHLTNTGVRERSSRNAYAHALKAVLDRRRNAG